MVPCTQFINIQPSQCQGAVTEDSDGDVRRFIASDSAS